MSCCEGDGGVAGEGKVVSVPKFHSWGKCTMPLYYYYAGPLFHMLGCNSASCNGTFSN